jgi:GT2 family glycosyltransferase
MLPDYCRIPFMKLPSPPSLEELQAHTPRFNPLPERAHRPLWSVMISTYNSGDYLRKALESVLCQDPGPDEMQIEVVDGCSTKDDPEKITAELGKGRVAFYKLPSNHGPAVTFNTCIERSYGHWIHILNGDDTVLPGFYEAYKRIIYQYTDLAMVCGRVVHIDEHGHPLSLGGPLLPEGCHIIDDFLVKQGTRNITPFVTVAIRREVYEKVGGFCTSFQHVTDMDMWFRAGTVGRVASVNQPYSCLRIHNNALTPQLRNTATNIRELYLLTLVNLARLKKEGIAIGDSWKDELAGLAEGTGWHFCESENLEGARNQALWAWALSPSYSRFKLLVKSHLLSMKSTLHFAVIGR